jgi:ABC-2 type transport system ATP-binding protein
VSVLGQDPWRADAAWRSRIGVVLQESEPDPGLTVAETLELYSGYYPQPRSIPDTLGLVGLSDQRDARATALSGGQRRRLDVALALIGDPEVLFLDEPTTGFDPAARRAAWDMIADLRATGTTVFLTTHAMDEAAFLADRIAIIARGRLIAEGTPASIGGRDSASSTISFSARAEALPDDIRGRVAPAPGGRLSFKTDTPLADLASLAAAAEAVRDLEVTRPSLEDVYLALTQEAVT